jgi:flavorubredoxin
MKYKHSTKFYKTRYNKYKAEMKQLGIVPIKEGAFISAYDSIAEKSKNPMKDIIYSSKYGTAYNYALAEKKALANVGIKVKLEEIKKMTTHEFADKYSTELYNARRQLLAAGKTKKEVALLISQQWFGSK